MIRIAITEAAFDAIAKTLPLGSVGYENKVNEKGERRRAPALSHCIKRMRRVERIALVVDEIDAITSAVVAPFPSMAVGAERLERPEPELVPIALMGFDMIGNGCGLDPAELQAGRAEWFERQLMATSEAPPLHPVPCTPKMCGCRISETRGHAAKLTRAEKP